MSSSSNAVKPFITKLAKDYPEYIFKPGYRENWSARTKTITYNPKQPAAQLKYGVLHELAHAILCHTNYQSDFELLKMEAEAWALAAKIAKNYRLTIDNEHIQNCLDTYRDWLHSRSACPVCGMHVLQKDARTYKCFNCTTTWNVSSRRFVRPYRRKNNL